MATSTANISLTRREASSGRRSGTSRAAAQRANRVHVERVTRTASARADAPVRHYKGVLIAIAAIALTVAMLYGPAREYYIAWRAGMELEERYQAVRDENARIQSEIDSLMTTEGIEAAARSLGYVADGETSVVVRGLPEEELVATTAETEEELPWYVGPLDMIFDYSE